MVNNNIIMISSDNSLLTKKEGNFYFFLEEYSQYWNRIDVFVPYQKSIKKEYKKYFGNIYVWNLKSNKLIRKQKTLKKVSQLMQKQKYDLVVSHDYFPFFNARIARAIKFKFKNISWVSEYHGGKCFGWKNYLYKKYYHKNDTLIKKVRIVNSNESLTQITDWGVSKNKIMELPSLYLSASDFKIDKKDKKTLDLIYSGRLFEGKGLEELIDIIAIVAKKLPEIKVNFIGSGPLKPKLLKQIKKKKLVNNIQLISWLPKDKLYQEIKKAKYYVFNSISEGGPRSVVEALALGVPVITTAVGVLPSIIKKYKSAGFLLKGDAKRKANIVLNALRKNRAFKDCNKLINDFGFEKSINNIAQHYQSVATNKNIIIFNLKTDANDDVLGFTTDWINGFAKKFNKVFVITMMKGKDETAKNVKVYSVGKEKGYSEFKRIREFYKIFNGIIRENQIDGIFAHMIPEFAILAGPIARKRKIPMILWYAHKSVTWRLRLAEKFVDRIFTPSKESCRLRNRKKIVVTGHGIDVEKFKRVRLFRKKSKIKRFLTISRISRIKNIDKMIFFISKLFQNNKNISLTIIGDPLLKMDKDYLAYCKKLVKDKGLSKIVFFKKAIPYKNIAKEYAKADYFLNFSETGSVDKTVLEAIAAGCIPITTNEAFKKKQFYFEAADKIQLNKLNTSDQNILFENNLENIAIKLLREL